MSARARRWGVTTHQVKYEGPSSHAMRVATELADAEGIELMSAEREQGEGGPAEAVLLTLTVEASAEAVMAAVNAVQGELPPGARVTVEGAVQGP